jgi:hypothetical protein
MSISTPSPKIGRAQDPNDYAGKTIRLRDDGSIPADNPFVDRRGHKPAIYTLGHRNEGFVTCAKGAMVSYTCLPRKTMARCSASNHGRRAAIRLSVTDG